jgi:hypothetical protein
VIPMGVRQSSVRLGVQPLVVSSVLLVFGFPVSASSPKELGRANLASSASGAAHVSVLRATASDPVMGAGRQVDDHSANQSMRLALSEVGPRLIRGAAAGVKAGNASLSARASSELAAGWAGSSALHRAAANSEDADTDTAAQADDQGFGSLRSRSTLKVAGAVAVAVAALGDC